MKKTERKRVRERAFAVGVNTELTKEQFGYSMEELESLICVAGGEVIETVIQHRKTPDPAFFIGKGKVSDIQKRIEALRPDLIVFNSELSPVQVKNLEDSFERKVVDRSELILDIFASRARTRQACLSVELAQLEYQLPRLKRMWTHLSRMEGGIGTRGPGEKQLEADRRLARRQIGQYKKKLAKIEDRIERWISSRSDEYNVALVGYTNTGKSTLMRRLSSKKVAVKDELFATIDTRTARVDLGDNNIILLSDTVGFIDHIPHDLIESFKATLMHAKNADLLLHVIDSSSPEAERRIRTVDAILEEIGCGDIDILRVFNKIDITPDRVCIRDLAGKSDRAVIVSVQEGENMDALVSLLKRIIREHRQVFRIEVDVRKGKLIAQIRRSAEIIECDYTENTARMELYGTSEFAEYLSSRGVNVEEISEKECQW